MSRWDNKSYKWLKLRKQWIKENPPDYGGYWYCVVGGRALSNKKSMLDYGALPLTLDHEIPRSRAPELVLELTNLKPMCTYHNNDKGSRSLLQYLATKPNKNCLF